MKVVIGDPAKELRDRLMRLLRWRVWIAEKLQPSEWQITLFWAGLVGIAGALASIGFREGVSLLHHYFTGSDAGVVDSFRELSIWQRLAVPAAGGLMAGLILLLGQRIAKGGSTTDYMEVLALGNGRVPARASLIKSLSAMFYIAAGGSVGKEGPMVQLSSVAGSFIGMKFGFSLPRRRLLVACGAAAGIASAYNAPIAGSFFVAEIILGTIAMETLGPLAVSAVAATLTTRIVSDSHALYQVERFTLNSPWEMGPYVVLGLIAGMVAPSFLRSLRAAEKLFVATRLPPILRLTLGGALVGLLAIWVPEVCGNGDSVVVSILNGQILWQALILIFVCKWLATAFSVGSGAPGGVFTPTLLMGASTGLLFGTAVNALWPLGAADPKAFAMVGMGAFLSAASRAPVMAVIMLFEMTLSYDIVLPLMLCAVVAYYTAKGFSSHSLYSESIKRKAAEQPQSEIELGLVQDLMKSNPPSVRSTAHFADIARVFLSVRVNNIYVTDEEGRFQGVVSLHDIKPYLSEPDLAEFVIANDILREDFPRAHPGQTLTSAMGGFLESSAERLPVVEAGESGRLLGSLAKSDLLLALAEKRKKTSAAG